jgi:hypothetical protein
MLWLFQQREGAVEGEEERMGDARNTRTSELAVDPIDVTLVDL